MAPRNKVMKMCESFRTLKQIRRKESRRKQVSKFIAFMLEWRRRLINVAFMTVLLLTNTQAMGPTARKPRSCRRLLRNTGWWENAWSNFDDKRFKRNFRVSRATFLYILGNIEGDLEKELSTDFPISPAFRLAVCLYRLARVIIFTQLLN